MAKSKNSEKELRAFHSRRESPRGTSPVVADGLNRSDPNSMAAIYPQFLEYLAVRNYSPRTVESRRLRLQQFILWCQERDLRRAQEITRSILEAYQRWLYRFRQENDKPLSVRTQEDRLTAVRVFFRWLCRERLLESNPASELEMPRKEKRLPRTGLSMEELEAVMEQPDLSDPFGLRDRAILETLYSTAIRRSELCNLDLSDLLADRKLPVVRQGKGKRDRVVPIGSRALEWIQRYLRKSRPKLEATVSPTLFLSGYGDRITPDHLSGQIARYLQKIGRRGSCHLFRHTCATHMLENGADIRYIQQLLGHANLDTTSVYTQLTIAQLQKVHALTHPGYENQQDETDVA